jgi:hypothetical protein
MQNPIDQIISRCAFRKLYNYDLESEAWRMNDHTMTWLLVNNIRSIIQCSGEQSGVMPVIT